MSTLPERARELRASLDYNDIPTTYKRPTVRGYPHELWIHTPTGKRFLVMVEQRRYTIFEDEGKETRKIDFYAAMTCIQNVYREKSET